LELEKELANFHITQSSNAYENLLIKVTMMNDSLGITKQELAEFIKMNHEAAMELVENDPKWASFWNQNQDNIVALEDAYVSVVGAQAAYFNETKRAFTRMTTFEKQMYKEQEDAAKAAEQSKAEAKMETYQAMGDINQMEALQAEQFEEVKTEITLDGIEKREGALDTAHQHTLDLIEQEKQARIESAQEYVNAIAGTGQSIFDT
jgi:hypothetical protein